MGNEEFSRCAKRYPMSRDTPALPHRSVVSHWAVFIKGIAAFHTGEIERAGKFLRSLPADSVPGKAARAYLLLAKGAGAALAPLPAAVLEGVGAGVSLVGPRLGG